jgi:hypothetical protein
VDGEIVVERRRQWTPDFERNCGISGFEFCNLWRTERGGNEGPGG